MVTRSRQIRFTLHNFSLQRTLTNNLYFSLFYWRARSDCCHDLPQMSGKCTRIEYCSLGRVAHTSYEIYEYTAITQSHTHREFWGIALAPTCEGHLCFQLAENFYKPSTRACGILLCDHVWACEATPNILQIEIKKINAPPGTFPWEPQHLLPPFAPTGEAAGDAQEPLLQGSSDQPCSVRFHLAAWGGT